MGASHHFPTGSKAPLNTTPARQESTIFTNTDSPTRIHQPSALIKRSTLAPNA